MYTTDHIALLSAMDKFVTAEKAVNDSRYRDDLKLKLQEAQWELSNLFDKQMADMRNKQNGVQQTLL